jgi:enterochelin esterase-like enzyme
MTLSYKDNSGNTKYASVASATAGCGEWKGMNGSFTLPNGANNPVIYFETSANNGDIYIDDVKITSVSGGNQTPTEPTQPTNPTKPSNPTNPSSSINMKNMKIDTFCPSSSMQKRAGVAYSSFQHKTYYSTTTRSNRGFNILLPANYNPQKKYPVLYVLHGIFGDENSMVSNGIDKIAANLAADGSAKEMIIVLPNMFAATNGAQPGFSDAGVQGYDNFVNDLTNDLMPYIEKNYSVKTGRDNTAIAGFSMGGRETLFIGLTQASKFGYVCACCPAPGATPARDNFMTHKGQLSEDQFKVANPANNPYILMIAAGTNDNVVGTFPKQYSNILNRNNQEHIYYEVPGGGHDNTTISSGLNNFIRAIFHN